MASTTTSIAAALLVLPALMLGRSGRAQMPATPLLQNAFANPGVTAAFNVASLGSASSYVAAGAWAPGSARFQLSAGVGAQTRAGTPTRTVYGFRFNIPVLGQTSSFGLSLFAGYGGLSGGGIDSSTSRSMAAAGATIGYRTSFGGGHGFSIYGSPIYESVGRGGGAGYVSVFRGAVGMDFGITSSIGATVGIEFGANESAESGKPSGTSFGAALSYAISGGR